ncbi:MAG: lipopolysaccharide transport periplasmic protein LptA [Janthinobacterium lividum]
MTYSTAGHPRHSGPSRRRSGQRHVAAWFAIGVSAVLAAIAPRAQAEQADRTKPLIYSADHLSYDDLKQTTILTGNVELTKGTIIVRGDRAELRQDPEGYSYATATRDKGLAYIREKRDGVDEYFEGNARQIDYDGKNDVSTLVGQAVARRLQGLTTTIDEVHGSTIRYDGQTGFYTATSGGAPGSTSSGRVRGMIAPTTGPTAPSAAPAGKTRASGSILAPAQTLEDPQ